MATQGNIEEFYRSVQYFLVKDVQGASKHRAVFLSVCGAATYMLSRNLVAPEKRTDKSFEDICGAGTGSPHSSAVGDRTTLQIPFSFAEGGRVDRRIRRGTKTDI